MQTRRSSLIRASAAAPDTRRVIPGDTREESNVCGINMRLNLLNGPLYVCLGDIAGWLKPPCAGVFAPAETGSDGGHSLGTRKRWC